MLLSSTARVSSKLEQESQSLTSSVINLVLESQNRLGLGDCAVCMTQSFPFDLCFCIFWSFHNRWHELRPWDRTLCVSSICLTHKGLIRSSWEGFFSLRRGGINPLCWTPHLFCFFFNQGRQINTSRVDSSLPSALVTSFIMGGIVFHGWWFLHGLQRKPRQLAESCQSTLRCMD